jgi:hypothetical protein
MQAADNHWIVTRVYGMLLLSVLGMISPLQSETGAHIWMSADYGSWICRRFGISQACTFWYETCLCFHVALFSLGFNPCSSIITKWQPAGYYGTITYFRYFLWTDVKFSIYPNLHCNCCAPLHCNCCAPLHKEPREVNNVAILSTSQYIRPSTFRV